MKTKQPSYYYCPYCLTDKVVHGNICGNCCMFINEGIIIKQELQRMKKNEGRNF